jgi:hypothetical protein
MFLKPVTGYDIWRQRLFILPEFGGLVVAANLGIMK